MPLYFFDVADGEVRQDYVGTELTSITSARIGAVRLAGEIMRDNPEAFVGDNELTVMVRDERGLVLFRVNLFVTEAPALVPVRGT